MAPTRMTALPPLTRANVPVSPRRQIVMDVFNMFDADGSGEIELDEIAKAFKTTGKLTDETRARLKAHFDFMDSDGSGEVTIEEFESALGHGKIAFRDYQHQQAFHALGLTLCQNLMVYRRHVLNQEFENMKQQQPPTSAAAALKAVQDQFDWLVRAQMMSTFALDLKRLPEEQSVDGGRGNGQDGNQGKGRGIGGQGGEWQRSENDTNNISRARTRVCSKDETLPRREARVLAQALKIGHPPRYLRPLSARRRRHIRAEILADVAAVKQRRDDNNGQVRTRPGRSHRVVLKKLPRREPRRPCRPALAY